VKDLSFENPSAPAVYQWQTQPQMDVQVNIGAVNVGTDVHEVPAEARRHGRGDQGTAFRIELLYAGLFALRTSRTSSSSRSCSPKGRACLFPFARQIIADTVTHGGFPPLLLDPIDFGGPVHAARRAGAGGGHRRPGGRDHRAGLSRPARATQSDPPCPSLPMTGPWK
jgi:preprotein translocase subunit SecB